MAGQRGYWFRHAPWRIVSAWPVVEGRFISASFRPLGVQQWACPQAPRGWAALRWGGSIFLIEYLRLPPPAGRGTAMDCGGWAGAAVESAGFILCFIRFYGCPVHLLAAGTAVQ